MTRELDRIRYARHLLLPEIGEEGQLRLLATHVRVPGEADAGAAEVAREYLVRAGVRVETEVEAGASPSPADGGARTPLSLPRAHDLLALAGAPELIEAARALSGALAAVESIKSALALGEPLRQPIAALPLEEA